MQIKRFKTLSSLHSWHESWDVPLLSLKPNLQRLRQTQVKPEQTKPHNQTNTLVYSFPISTSGQKTACIGFNLTTNSPWVVTLSWQLGWGWNAWRKFSGEIRVAFQKHKSFQQRIGHVCPMRPHDNSAGWKYTFHCMSWGGRSTEESTKQWLQGFIQYAVVLQWL